MGAAGELDRLPPAVLWSRQPLPPGPGQIDSVRAIGIGAVANRERRLPYTSRGRCEGHRINTGGVGRQRRAASRASGNGKVARIGSANAGAERNRHRLIVLHRHCFSGAGAAQYYRAECLARR